MRIAFISFEYPKETGGGGIGTYLKNIIPALNQKGHNAIVLCGTHKKNPFWENLVTYRIPCNDKIDFNNKILSHFIELNSIHAFDIIEGTDFLGWGVVIKEKFPDMPYVVRLHTPSFLIDSLQFTPLSGVKKIYFIIACLLNGKTPKIKTRIDINQYLLEIKALKLADRLLTPTFAVAEKLVELGIADANQNIDCVPFFIPEDQQYSEIVPRKTLSKPQIIFIGRLEIRKGVIELAKAIPLIIEEYPNCHFTFVGGAAESPVKNVDMLEFLKERLGDHLENISFTNRVPNEEIKKYLTLGDIFVFPSHFESFGFVCLETMAAGKCIIASKNGGMKELLDNGNCGLLIDPNPVDIVEGIFRLLNDNQLRLNFGIKAKNRVVEYYNKEHLINLQIASYQNAIETYKLKVG